MVVTPHPCLIQVGTNAIEPLHYKTEMVKNMYSRLCDLAPRLEEEARAHEITQPKFHPFHFFDHPSLCEVYKEYELNGVGEDVLVLFPVPVDEDAVADEPAPSHDRGEAEDLLRDDPAVSEDAGPVGAHPARQPVDLVVVVHHDDAVRVEGHEVGAGGRLALALLVVHPQPRAGPPVGEEEDLAVDGVDEVVVDSPEEGEVVPGDEDEGDVLEGVDDYARDEESDEEERVKDGNLPPRLQK